MQTRTKRGDSLAVNTPPPHKIKLRIKQRFCKHDDIKCFDLPFSQTQTPKSATTASILDFLKIK